MSLSGNATNMAASLLVIISWELPSLRRQGEGAQGQSLGGAERYLGLSAMLETLLNLPPLLCGTTNQRSTAC